MFSRDSGSHVIDTPEFKRWFGDWELTIINSHVNSQVERWGDGKLTTAEILQFGSPGRVLRQFGVLDLPIHLMPSVPSKAVNHKHEIDLADLNDIALNAHSTVVVFRSKSADDRIMLVTEACHADGNVVVAFGWRQTSMGSRSMTSAASTRSDMRALPLGFEDGLLMGYENSKGCNWLMDSAASNSQQPQVKAALGNATVYDTSDIRNSSRVVDAEGKPLVVYHRTNADFAQFRQGEQGSGADGTAVAAAVGGGDSRELVGKAEQVVEQLLN